jgi:hypothetical protein
VSAWIISRKHIDLLVTVIIRSEIVATGGKTPTEIGRTLWQENHNSVNYRYDENTPTPTYTHQPYAVPPADATWYLFALKQIDCYRYQSCEHPGWAESEANTITQALAEHLQQQAEREYPGMSSPDPATRWNAEPPAYRDAPWGI